MNQANNYLMLKTRIQKVVSENFPSVNNFANRCKIPQSTIHRWMDTSDKNPPGLDIILKLVEYLPTLNIKWLLQPDNQKEDNESIVMQLNETEAKYSTAISSKDSMIELQQKHIGMLEKEIERLTALVPKNKR